METITWNLLPKDHEYITWEQFEYIMSLDLDIRISRPEHKEVSELRGMINPKWIWTMLCQNSWDTLWIDAPGIPERVWNIPNKWIEEKDLP